MKSETIQIRLSPEEKKQFSELCDHHVRTFSGQFCFMLRESYNKMSMEKIEDLSFEAALKELGKPGVVAQADKPVSAELTGDTSKI